MILSLPAFHWQQHCTEHAHCTMQQRLVKSCAQKMATQKRKSTANMVEMMYG